MLNKRHLLSALVIGLVAGNVSWLYQITFGRQAGDLTWALDAARDLLAGQNPYTRPLAKGMVAYPLPAALFAFPLSSLSNEVAAGIFIGFSSALLAWGLLKTNEPWRLLVFVSFPYIQAVQVVNWSPLFLAVWYLPALLPLTLAKPHIGLPIALLRLTKQRAVGCLLFALLSFLFLWNWPIQWLSQVEGYAGRPALLVLPFGPLLLVLLPNWRSERVQYLLLCAFVPFRPFYDYVLLWRLPNNRQEMLLVTLCSWIGYFGWYYFSHFGAFQWMVLTVYMPLLFLLRPRGYRLTKKLAPRL